MKLCSYALVQINIPQELVSYIVDSMAQGLITRGLFHEAALNIFSVLILYWKKFCLARFAPKRQRSAIKSASSLYQMKRQEWPGQGATGHEEHREWHAFFGGKSLSLSLSYMKLRNLGYIILFQCLFDRWRTNSLLLPLSWHPLVLPGSQPTLPH